MTDTLDPSTDLTLETVIEPGDIVRVDPPIGGESLSDNTEYTHGIVVEIVHRYTDRPRDGAPKVLGVAKYTPDPETAPAGGRIDLESGTYTGIPGIADCLAEELILLYKTGRETGYSPHNEHVMDLIDQYAESDP
jgi:hypothetical protein